MSHQANDHHDTRGRNLANLSHAGAETCNRFHASIVQVPDVLCHGKEGNGYEADSTRTSENIESKETASYEPVKEASSASNQKVESKLHPSATRPRSKSVKEQTSTWKPETRFQVHRGEAVGRVSNPGVEDSF